MVVTSYLQHNRSSNYSQASLSTNLTGLELVEEFSTEMEISSSLFVLLVTQSMFALSGQMRRHNRCLVIWHDYCRTVLMSVHFSEVTNYMLISWDECPFV